MHGGRWIWAHSFVDVHMVLALWMHNIFIDMGIISKAQTHYYEVIVVYQNKLSLKYFFVIPPTWSVVNAASLMIIKLFAINVCGQCRKVGHILDTYFVQNRTGPRWHCSHIGWDLPWHMWWPPNNVIFLSFSCAKGPPFLVVYTCMYIINSILINKHIFQDLKSQKYLLAWGLRGGKVICLTLSTHVEAWSLPLSSRK